MSNLLIDKYPATSSEILDYIKVVFEIKNDAQLAEFLGVTRTSIHTLRQEGRLLGKKTRLVVMEKISYLGITNWRERLAIPYLRIALRNSGLNLELQTEKTDQSEFLSLLKGFYKCETDLELSEHLDLMPNTLSMFRVGRTTLGPLPLLRVLCEIENLPLQEIRTMLISNAMLEEQLVEYSKGKLRTR